MPRAGRAVLGRTPVPIFSKWLASYEFKGLVNCVLVKADYIQLAQRRDILAVF